MAWCVAPLMYGMLIETKSALEKASPSEAHLTTSRGTRHAASTEIFGS